MASESVMFLMSMSNTMATLWPAPIEMDFIDEGELVETENDARKINASRWTICSDIIRLHLKRMKDCGVEVSIGKSTDLGVSMTRGNSDDKLQSLLDVVKSISKVTKSNGEANAEFAIREIEKMARAEKQCDKKQIHWLVDAEMFVDLDLELINRKFPPNLVNMYVIGELRTFHENFESSKEVTNLLILGNVNVRFLVCPADLYELRSEILSEKRYETSENSVKCRVGKSSFEIKVLQTHRVGKPVWLFNKIRFIGFLPEIDLCRVGFFTQKISVESQVSISCETSSGNQILWSLAEYMFSEFRKPRVVLFSYKGEKKNRGFCFMVASEEKKGGGAIMSLIQLRKSIKKKLKKSLELVEEIDEKSTPLPNRSYQQVAPADISVIKRRMMEIGKTKEPEAKRMKFEKFAGEYDLINGRNTFMETTSAWRKHYGLVDSKNADGNNNS
ncbi:hypothetical protein CRE_08920 [Caenorhabditis remanei]|uniref:Uncharacterized protein n=1 Tax=Caenorhabditis remanei TaxID=31234 RepID=E3LIA5_CAERE|nr:hypothetical protein CRE_08920 [Caenorhabditis remanei]